MKAEALALTGHFNLCHKALSPKNPQPPTHTHSLLTLKLPYAIEMQKENIACSKEA